MDIDLISLVIGGIAGAALVGVYAEFRRLNERISWLQVDHLKRVPNGTMATLEDVRAVVNDTRFQDADVNDVINSLLGALILSEKKRSYDGEAFERVEELVRDIQTNPRKYKDRPSRKVKLV